MRGQPGVIRTALAFAVLLGALSFVIWRQGRALKTLEALEEVRRERAVLEAERVSLLQRIQRLESRSRVVAAAEERLGMHVPTGREIVILPMGSSAVEGEGR